MLEPHVPLQGGMAPMEILTQSLTQLQYQIVYYAGDIFSAGLFSIGIFSTGVFSIGLFSFGTFVIGVCVNGRHLMGKYKNRLE
jgi:hypothetical protein